jgi:hypothetical protein
MGFKKYAVILSIIANISSPKISWGGERIMYQNITDNKPDIGISTTVYLGDRMLEQRRGQWQECIIPKFERSENVNFGFAMTFVKKGVPLCKSSTDSNEYISPYENWSPDFSYPFALKREKNGELNICISALGIKSACTKGKRASDYDTSPYFSYSENSFQQTIEYAGRSGSVLRFNYSEFTDGFARQAFTREFQVDLSQGNVAAYKGAIIEIESATNASITYKVVRNFQQ